MTPVVSHLPAEPTVGLPQATQPSTLTPSPIDAASPIASPKPPETTQLSSPTAAPVVSASPTASPEPPEVEATPGPSPETFTFQLFEEQDMVPGQTIRLEGTGIEVTLVEAHGPPPDCFDCPNSATLNVRFDGETQELTYSFSGMMELELLQHARRKAAFGYVFVAARIDEGSFTLRVEPATQ